MNDTDFSFLIASKFPGTGPSYLNCSSFCLKYKTRSFKTVFIVSFGKYFENNNRDVLVYYAISWQFLLKVLILSLISTLCIGIGLLLFVVPGILIAGLLIFVNYFAILENKTVLESLNLSWEKSKLNFFQCILMAGFFWFITILTITILSAISGSYEELNQISQTYTIISSSLAIYIQVCLISFPILVFYKNQSLDEIKDSV